MPFPRPWFPFYTVDFWNDSFVRGLDYAEAGLYIRLLCEQWEDGFLPDDPPAIAKRTHSELRAVEALLVKFPLGPDGKRRNPRQHELREAALNKSKTNRLTAVRSHRERHANKMRSPGESESESEVRDRSSAPSGPPLSTNPQGRDSVPGSTPSRAGWNERAAELIRKICYIDGREPSGTTIAQDLKWVRLRLDEGRTMDAIECALRGVRVVISELKGKKYAPSRLFSKKGPWVNLFDRALVADAGSHRPRALRELLPPQLKGPSHAEANTD